MGLQVGGDRRHSICLMTELFWPGNQWAARTVSDGWGPSLLWLSSLLGQREHRGLSKSCVDPPHPPDPTKKKKISCSLVVSTLAGRVVLFEDFSWLSVTFWVPTWKELETKMLGLLFLNFLQLMLYLSLVSGEHMRDYSLFCLIFRNCVLPTAQEREVYVCDCVCTWTGVITQILWVFFSKCALFLIVP